MKYEGCFLFQVRSYLAVVSNANSSHTEDDYKIYIVKFIVFQVETENLFCGCDLNLQLCQGLLAHTVANSTTLGMPTQKFSSFQNLLFLIIISESFLFLSEVAPSQCDHQILKFHYRLVGCGRVRVECGTAWLFGADIGSLS